MIYAPSTRLRPHLPSPSSNIEPPQTPDSLDPHCLRIPKLHIFPHFRPTPHMSPAGLSSASEGTLSSAFSTPRRFRRSLLTPLQHEFARNSDTFTRIIISHHRMVSVTSSFLFGHYGLVHRTSPIATMTGDTQHFQSEHLHERKRRPDELSMSATSTNISGNLDRQVSRERSHQEPESRLPPSRFKKTSKRHIRF